MADWDEIDLQVKFVIAMRLSTNLRTLLGTMSAATWTKGMVSPTSPGYTKTMSLLIASD
jgi:hypothetical protein